MAISGINPLALQGLVSGMDTESIIKLLVQSRQKQLDNLTAKREEIEFRKTTLRAFNSQVLALQNAVFNLRLENAFMTKNATSSDQKVVTATAQTTASPGQHLVKVNQLAQAALVTSNLFVSRLSNNPPNTAGITGLEGVITPTPMFIIGGVCEGTTEGTIGTSIGIGNNNLTVTVDGTTVNVTLANATANTTSLSSVAADLELKINDALNQARGTTNVIYIKAVNNTTAGASNDKLYLINNFDGAKHSITVDFTSSAAAALGLDNPANITTMAGTDPAGGDHNLTFYDATQASITGANTAGLFTINATNNKLNITVNGVTNEITLTEQTAVNGDLMASSLQADINAVFGAGAVIVNYDGSKFQIVNSKAGASNNLNLSAASGNDARATLGLDTVTSIAGTNARAVDIFTPTSGASSTRTIEDTTTAGTASDMAGLLAAVNGWAPAAGHTSVAGVQLIPGVTLCSTGLTAGTALIRTGNGNELNTTPATCATYVSVNNITTAPFYLNNSLKDISFNTAASSATNGSFTINGKTITISDYQTESLSEVMAKINSSGAGVTCTYDAVNNRLVLTANTPGGGQNITIGSPTDTSDFLYVAGFYGDGAGYTEGTDKRSVDPAQTLASGGFSVTPTSGVVTINGVSIYINSSNDTLNDVIEKINSSAAGVTASYNSTSDTFTLMSKSDDSGTDVITLGGPGDTSNFFYAVKLVYPPNIESGVTTDLVLNVPTQVGQPGQRALFEVDGSSYNRKGNTVSDVITGVTLNLQSAQTASSAPVTVNVTSNTEQAVEKVADFILEYNRIVEMASPQALTKEEREKQLPELTVEQMNAMSYTEIEEYNSTRESLRMREVLRRDTSVRSLYNDLRRMVSSAVSGVSEDYNLLSKIGINTGDIGSSWGANPHGMLLTVSTDREEIEKELRANTTFMNRLESNPEEVSKLFAQLTNATLTRSGSADASSVVLTGENKVRVGNGTSSVEITLAADTYTGAKLANTLNQKLRDAGINDITFLLNSSNKIDIKAEVNAGDNPNGQAIIDIADLTGELFRTHLGITPGYYYGPTVHSLTGIGRRLENLSKDYTRVGGVLQEKIKANGDIDRELRHIDSRIDDMEDRIAMEEQRLWKRFTALETYMSQANAQSQWLSQRLGMMNSSGSWG